MIELAELIRRLRAELVEAMAVSEGEVLRFALGSVDLELSVAVQREAHGSGKLRFWVAELGADAGQGRTDTQLIRLRLDPQLRGNGAPTGVLIDGEGADGED